MKVTIIPIDGAVYIDGASYSQLSWLDTPVNVHAIQWENSEGWIEYNDGSPNETITSLPNWAELAIDAWNNANIKYQAESQKNSYEDLTFEQKIDLVRIERDKRIAASDWTQADDVKRNKSAEWTVLWESYRQALRDLPSLVTAENIVNIPWPIAPNA
jgi:hypothetical protein